MGGEVFFGGYWRMGRSHYFAESKHFTLKKKRKKNDRLLKSKWHPYLKPFVDRIRFISLLFLALLAWNISQMSGVRPFEIDQRVRL